jgi:hypothetical protein
MNPPLEVRYSWGYMTNLTIVKITWGEVSDNRLHFYGDEYGKSEAEIKLRIKA